MRLLIALCAVLMSPLATAEWVEFSKGTNSKYYYDPETLTNKRYTRVNHRLPIERKAEA